MVVGVGVVVLLGFIWLSMFSAILKTDNSVWHATWLDIVHRTSLMQTPPKDRGLLWKAWSWVFHWTYEQPLYIAGPTGTDKLLRASGKLPVPLAEGIAIFDYRTISEMLMSDNQPRGRFLATGAVPDVCLGKDTLIFLPTTPGGKSQHDQLRSFVVKVLRGFYLNETTDRGVQWMGEPVVEKDNVPQPTQGQLVRYLVSTMFYRLFGRAPVPAEADVILSYFDSVMVCFFGTGVPGDLLARNSRVPEIRQAVLEIARKSPTGDKIAVEVALWNQRCSLVEQPNRIDERDCLPIDETAMLQQVVDGYLFAGLLGTTELATSAFSRLRSHPALYGPMWQRDPVAFLVECARLNPPVSSVTALLDTDRELYVGVGWADMFGGYEAGGHKVLYPKGTPVQMLISQANRDSSVFGHTANQFDPTRSTLGRVLSWNGVEMNVRERTAPRGCPGHDLAIDVARVLITHFWNDKNTTPSGEPAPGDCFDGMECHAELDLSSVLVYERIAKPRQGFELLFAVAAIAVLSLELVRCVLWSGPCRSLFAFLFRLVFAGDDVLAFIWKGALLAQILCLFGYLRDATLPAHLSMVGVANALLLIAVVVVAGRGGWLYGYSISLLVLFASFVTAAIVTMTSFGLGEYFVADAAYLVTVFFLAAVGLCFVALYFLYPRDKQVSEHFWLALIFAFAAVPLFKFFATGLLLAVVCGTGFVYCFDLVLQDIRSDYLGRRVIVLANRFVQPLVCVVVVLVLIAPVVLGVWQVKSAYTGICTEWSMPNGSHVDPSADPLCKSPLLDRLDTYTKFVWGATRSDANDESRTPVKDSSEIHPPVRRAQLTSIEILDFPYYIPYQDEDTPVRSWKQGLLSWFSDYITHSEVFFPLNDVVYDFNSADEARHLTRLINGPLAFNISDEENYSDQALVRWTFFGFGAHRVRRVKSSIQAGWNARFDDATEHQESFVVDLLWMAALDVRPGFAHYGAAAYFGSKDDGFAPRRISLPKANNPKVWRDVYPGDADWDYAKYAFRSSLLVGVTLADHLSLAHLRLSSVVVQAARETLSTIHPLRLLLAPFSFRTIEINRGAASNLAAKLGVLHRAVALSWKGLETGFRVTLTNDYEYLLEEQLSEGLNDTIPYVQDGQDFKRIVEKFVADYLIVYYPTEDALFSDADLAHFLREIDAFGFPVPPIRNRQELINFVREFIMVVTAYHYQVGTVAPYVLDPYAASGKIRPGIARGDVQSTFLVSVIALFTSYPQPMLLGNFSHLLLQDEHYPQTNAIFDQFHADLDALTAIIDARNHQRPWPFEAFNPRFLRSAVSI